MTDTIAAIATALSPSGIGIVRISGPESREIAGKVYRSKGGKRNFRMFLLIVFIMDLSVTETR